MSNNRRDSSDPGKGDEREESTGGYGGHRCISRSHLFHVSLAFISLEHQLEAACKRYTCQAKRLALPAGSLFMDETSPRPKKRAQPECSLSSATRNTIVLLASHSGVRPAIFQLVPGAAIPLNFRPPAGSTTPSKSRSAKTY